MRLLPAFLVLLAAGPALAQSNNGNAAYPQPKCEKPAALQEPPRLPPGVSSVKDASYNTLVRQDAVVAFNQKMIAYNAAVGVHNAAMKVYGTCIDAYVDAAKADIARIDAAIGDAMASANDP